MRKGVSPVQFSYSLNFSFIILIFFALLSTTYTFYLICEWLGVEIIIKGVLQRMSVEKKPTIEWVDFNNVCDRFTTLYYCGHTLNWFSSCHSVSRLYEPHRNQNFFLRSDDSFSSFFPSSFFAFSRIISESIVISRNFISPTYTRRSTAIDTVLRKVQMERDE